MAATRRVILFPFLLALFVFGCASVSTGGADMRDNGEIVVTGILERVMAVGGETTGLAVKLDSPLTLGGKVYSRIEVDRKGVDVSPLIGTRVEVTGKVVSRKGIERGEYPALELIAIRRLE